MNLLEFPQAVEELRKRKGYSKPALDRLLEEFLEDTRRELRIKKIMEDGRADEFMEWLTAY